jgi:hypothetical protein
MSSADSHNFSAILPSSLDSGAEYYIEVTDTAGQRVRAPSDAPVSAFISNNTPPRIDPALHFSVSEVIADSADNVTVSVNLTDDFGVHSAKVILSRSGVVIQEVPLILASGTPRNGTWIANVTVNSPAGIVEVDVMAHDGRATTYANAAGLRVVAPPHRWFGSVAMVLVLAGVAGIVAVALVVWRFNRAKRS